MIVTSLLIVNGVSKYTGIRDVVEITDKGTCLRFGWSLTAYALAVFPECLLVCGANHAMSQGSLL